MPVWPELTVDRKQHEQAPDRRQDGMAAHVEFHVPGPAGTAISACETAVIVAAG